jgi:hypothetical protein
VFEPSTVSVSPLPPGKYTIKLSVTADSRLGSTQVQLNVVGQETFDIEILVNSTAFNTYGVVNQDEDLRLVASMALPTGGSINNASWASTLEKEHPYPYKSSSVNCPFLVVDPNYFIPRRSYTFQFAASAMSGNKGIASITVPVNAPPSPGRCTVGPTTGVAADTPFTLFCADWVDEQLPLRYEFEVEGEIGTVPLVRKSENSMIQVRFALSVTARDSPCMGSLDFVWPCGHRLSCRPSPRNAAPRRQCRCTSTCWTRWARAPQ